MSDELAIQQGQSTNPAYPLAGAAVGGLAGGYGAHYLTKPKYGSFDDIIKEAKDSADFKSRLEKAEGEEKSFLERAKEVANKKEAAGAEYDNAFEEWKKENSGVAGKQETPEYKKLVEAEQAAEKALNDKKTKLVNEEIERLKTTGAETKTATIEEALNRKSRQIADTTKYYEKLKAKNASKEKLKQVAQRIADLQKEADKLANEIAEKFEYKGLTGEALEAKQKEVADAYKLALQKRVEQKMKRFDDPLESADKTLLNNVKKNREAIAKQTETINAQLDKLSERIGFDAKAMYERGNIEVLEHKIKNARAKEDIHIKRLTKLKEAYAKVTETTTGTGSGSFSWTTFIENLEKLGTGEAITGTPKDIQAELEKYLTDNKSLDENERKAVKKLIDGEINAESIDKAIEVANERKNSIDKALEKMNNAVDKHQELLEERSQLKQACNERGVYVNKKGELIDVKTQKAINIQGVPGEKPKEVKLPEGIKEPKDVKLEYSSRVASTLSEAELKAQAEAAIKPEAYKNEAEAFNAAKAARETAYKGLEDAPAKTAEELQKAFNEFKGYESREKFMDTQAEEATKKFKDDFKKQLERKYGFAEHANWKIAGVAAAGAALIGGLAYMLAPKDKA